MWEEFNNNPAGRRVGDCAVRAIAKALDVDWETAFLMLIANAFDACDMPSADGVWGMTLRQHGFKRKSIPNECPDCYTARDFLTDHPEGTFVLGFGGHVATARDAVLFDSFNSLMETPIFYWYKEEESEE